MSCYLVIHDIQSFEQHPRWIGREGKEIWREFERLARGDGIAYYCKGDQVITGTFRVASKARTIADDSKWLGPHVVVDIKPVAEAAPPYVPMKRLLEEIAKPLSIFPSRKIEGIKLKGRTLIPMNDADFELITGYVRQYLPPKNRLFHGPPNEAGLGKPGDYVVMNYAPTSEQGIVALFVGHMKELGFETLEFVRQGFPDACAIQQSETGTYSRKYIEFEFRASQFRQHVDNPKHNQIWCDYVVCWENDFPYCPVKCIELKSEMERILGKTGRSKR